MLMISSKLVLLSDRVNQTFNLFIKPGGFCPRAFCQRYLESKIFTNDTHHDRSLKLNVNQLKMFLCLSFFASAKALDKFRALD